MVFVARYFLSVGDLKLAMVNFVPLFLAFLLFMRPSAFLTAVNDGVKVVAGIIIQHPFYASIIGILSASGLAVAFADAFGRFASAVWSFISRPKAGRCNGLHSPDSQRTRNHLRGFRF